MISRVNRQLISFASAGPERAVASFRIGLEGFPYLADHGFQDLTVLPGAFYFELALGLQIERLHLAAGRILNAEFHSPLILASGSSVMTAEVTRLAENRCRYVFRETSQATADQPPLATLEIDSGSGTAMPARRFAGGDLPATIERPDLYARLRRNGNQYGPLFQGLAQLAPAAGRAQARLAAPLAARDLQEYYLHPVAVDAAIQLLGTANWDNGQTYVLRGISEIKFRPGALGPTGRVEASWNQATAAGLSGDATVYDEAGMSLLELRGVRIAYLATAPELVIASTFTAEPIEPALQFWSQAAATPIKLSFAPYAQVFQELLKPDSRFRRNQSGMNVLLLNLGDWITQSPRHDSPVEPAAGAADWQGLQPHTLPNGLQVAHLNRHETEYVYREIFEDQCYLRHGIHLSGAQNVIDIGANIGLFSLFVRSQRPQAKVFSFEPSPVAFRALSANCSRYGPGLYPFNVGVAERRGTAQLTFYEKSSVFSSFHPDRTEDRRAIRAVVANLVQGELRVSGGAADEYVDQLMTDRLDSQTFDCPLVSVSDIIRDHGLQFVDLLKVDAEKCELEILRGIEPEHWPLIGQMVIEVHDATGRDLAEVQSILTRQGFRCAVEEEQLLAGSGLFNVYATRPGTPGPSLVADLQNKADQLVSALAGFVPAAAGPTFLAVCPAQSRRGAEAAALALVEDDLLRRLESVPGLSVLGSRALVDRYPGADWFNAQTDRLGHIPYSDVGFAALGTSVFRALAAFRRVPYKVIALDCDHTLWDGGVGEDGPAGVQVTGSRRMLQEFMLRQMRAGMLLCLCSKNREADVWAVLAENAGMVLRREHIAAARINWSPKSENLRALAAELNVGLDSFIFVDDNPVECAEVRANCPGPLVLELPPQADAAAAMLEQVWAFDHPPLTAEDGRRTQMMREGAQREQFRGQVATLDDFIAGLELKVDIAEPPEADLSRVAQLTQRTNQFNFTTVRRTEAELKQFLERSAGRALAVRVRDRFGDYGLVGAALYEVRADRYRLDTFLLSCRVLGRGVEHQVLAEIGRRAELDGKAWVELAVAETERNLPAREFAREVTGSGGLALPAKKVAGLKWGGTRPPSFAEATEGRPGASSGAARGPASNEPEGRISPHFHPEQYPSAQSIAAAIEAHRLGAAGFDPAASAETLPPDLTGQLLHLWRKTLGNPRVGLDDNFLDVGGTSLKAVQLVAAIRRELQRPVAVVTFFECPTVRKLSEKLEPKAAPAAANPMSDAMERGARRHQRLKRPRESR